MPDIPYPILSDDFAETKPQIVDTLRDIYENRVGGASVGDVFQIGGEVLELKIKDGSGLVKTNGELDIDISVIGSSGGIVKANYTAKGVVLVGTGASSIEAKTVGADGSVFKASSGSSCGIDWANVTATEVTNTPTGTISATTVQAAINELDTEKTTLTAVKADADVASAISLKHAAVTVSVPISLSGQALSLVNDAAATITEIDTGALANSDTVIPTSKAVTTAIAGVSGGDVTAASNLTDNCLVRGDGGAKGIQTTGIVVDDSGRMVNTNQPAFLAYINATQSNVTGDGTFWSAVGDFWTEVYDQGSCFYQGTFTAPVTGKYNFNCGPYMQELGSSHVFAILLYTSNALCFGSVNMPTGLSSTLGYYCSFIAVDMDANDTAYMQVVCSGSTKTVDVATNNRGSIFSGHLVC